MQRTSSQLHTQLMQLRKESLKRFSYACRDSNPDHCDPTAALQPIDLGSQLQGWSSDWFVIYANCTSLIMHLIWPPNILHNLCFSFLLGITSLRTDVFPQSQETLKTILTQNFGEQIRCIMGDVQLAYIRERWRCNDEYMNFMCLNCGMKKCMQRRSPHTVE